MPRFNVGDRVRLKRAPAASGVVVFSRTDFTGGWNYVVEWDVGGPRTIENDSIELFSLLGEPFLYESWLKRDKRKRPPCTR